MTHFRILSANDAEKWDSLVKNFENHDVYYLAGYSKAMHAHGDGEPVLFYYEKDGIKAINVVMKRDIAKEPAFFGVIPEGKYFDLATPYGYGGFLVEGIVTNEKTAMLDETYTSFCKESGIVSEFARFHPVIRNSRSLGNMYEITDMGNTISIDLRSKSAIWENLSSKNRNMIRKAVSSGVVINTGNNEELYDAFKTIYDSTMVGNKASKYYFFEDEYYKHFLNRLTGNSSVFYALYDKKIVAMSIILYCNKQMHYHLSGSCKEYRHLAPTNLLLYEAACWGSENGFKTFHLGGGLGSRQDNLYNFKKSFNKNSVNVFSVGKKIFNKTAYEYLVSCKNTGSGVIAEAEKNGGYFPEYREK